MRTAYFRQIGLETDEIQSDVASLRRLTHDQIIALGKFLSKGSRLIIRDDAMTDDIQEFLRNSLITAEEYSKTRRLTVFLTSAIEKFNDSPEDLIEDLNDLIPLGSEIHNLFIGLIESFSRTTELRRLHLLARQGLPTLTNISYVCDIRVDFEQFNIYKDNPNDREAKPRAWVPVVIFHLGTDENPELICQLDSQLLDRTIKILIAAQKDLLQIKSALSESPLPVFDPSRNFGINSLDLE